MDYYVNKLVSVSPLYCGFSTPTHSGFTGSNGAKLPINDPIPARIRAGSNHDLPRPIDVWFTNRESLLGMIPSEVHVLGQGVQKGPLPPITPYKSWGDWAENAWGLFSGDISRWFYKAVPANEKPVIHSNLVGSVMEAPIMNWLFTPKGDGTGYTQGPTLSRPRYAGFRVSKLANGGFALSPDVWAHTPIPYHGIWENILTFDEYWKAHIFGRYFVHGGSYTTELTNLQIIRNGSFVVSISYDYVQSSIGTRGWTATTFKVEHLFERPLENSRVWGDVNTPHVVDMRGANNVGYCKLTSRYTVVKVIDFFGTSQAVDVTDSQPAYITEHVSYGTPLIAGYGSPRGTYDLIEMVGYRGEGYTPKIDICQDLEIFFEENRSKLAVTAYFAAMKAAQSSMELVSESIFEAAVELSEVTELFDFRHKLVGAFLQMKDWKRSPMAALQGLLDLLSSGYLIWQFGLNPTIGAGLDLHNRLRDLANHINGITGVHTIHGDYFSPIPVLHRFSDFGRMYVESNVKIRTCVSDVPWILALLGARALNVLPTLSSLWNLSSGSFLIEPVTGIGQKLERIDTHALFVVSTEVHYVVGSTRLFLLPHAETWAQYNTVPLSGPDRTFGEPAATYFRRFVETNIPTATDNPWGFSEPSGGYLPPMTCGALLYQVAAGKNINAEQMALRDRFRQLRKDYRQGRRWGVSHPTYKFAGKRRAKAWTDLTIPASQY